MATNKHDSYPVLEFEDSKALESWLKKNHTSAEGVWLKMAKAKAGIKTVNYPEAVEVALCYGWIDGLARRIDDNYYVQKFTPRRPNSLWSVINKKKVAALIKSGRMQAAGLAAIQEAKKNGRWKSAYESPAKIKVPADLQEALNQNKAAKLFFETLTGTNRYALLFRLSNVKREETRKKKIVEYLKMLEEGKTI
jgi:uncharacterized protein YdeI (YjbR/CyaY-like superfamily)